MTVTQCSCHECAAASGNHNADKEGETNDGVLNKVGASKPEYRYQEDQLEA